VSALASRFVRDPEVAFDAASARRLLQYLGFLERRAHLNLVERRELLAAHPELAGRLAAMRVLCESEAGARVLATVPDGIGGSGGSESEAHGSIVDDVMTTKQVAEYLGIRQRSVHQARERGRLEGWKTGARWRFDRRSVEAFEARRRGA
jgi:excisionase family DNA binding protein